MLVPSNGTGVEDPPRDRPLSGGDRGRSSHDNRRHATTTTDQEHDPGPPRPPALVAVHTRLVLGLGTAWVLDGLSVTIASSVSSKLTQPNTLNLTTTQAASIGTIYLVGEVVGALVFGRLSDQLGRRNLFMWTLAVYLVGTGLTALTPRGADWIIYLFATRFIAGTGIGGEYSAINSAIDEMMPARYRGRTDIWINGTYWLGAILGTFASFLLLNSLRPAEGWRVAFLVGLLLSSSSLCGAISGKPTVAHRARPRSKRPRSR